MASSNQQTTSVSGGGTKPLKRQAQDETLSDHDEEYLALHTSGIYKGRPPFLDPRGAKGKPFGPPPIQVWADKLMDKRLIAEDEVGDNTVCLLSLHLLFCC